MLRRGNRVAHRLRINAADAQVDHACAVLCGPDDPVGDVRVVARPGRVEHLDRDDRRSKGDAGDPDTVVGCGPCDSGDVRSVPVVVGCGAGHARRGVQATGTEVGPQATGQVGMGRIHA